MAKILLVEDDPELLKSYEDALKSDGHSIVKAVDGSDGFIKVQNQKFDLIMTDLQMPKVTGQKFIELLQKGDTAISCPIIISSGFIDSNVINSFSGNTRIHFLPKPTSVKELKAKIKELLTVGVQKSKIDVRFINPVLSSTIEVITSMTKFSVTAGKPHIKVSGERSGDISGVVGVVGAGFKGTISLSFSEAGFLTVISKMFGEEIKEIDDENKDAVAELLNIIFGKAKKILNEGGLNIQPAIPSIIRGKDHSIEHHSKNQTIIIPYLSEDIGDFRVEVSSVG